jgi:hypothetical protein
VPTDGMAFDGIDFDSAFSVLSVLFTCIVQNSKSVDINHALCKHIECRVHTCIVHSLQIASKKRHA